jgi:type I restriction enzyme S subunit
MEVKHGYKQTEAGVIPEEWRVETIRQLIDERSILGHLDGNHGELYPRSHEFKSHGVPYIGANDFEEGNVSFDHCKFLAADRAKQFRKGVARDGDVLFAHNATVGPVALLRTDEPFVILSTTATYFRCDSSKLNNLYLKAALQSEYFGRQYQAVMAQSTRFQVPITAQRKLSLVIPPPPEQRAIAAALGDSDKLLTGLDRLIAKKRDLKQAAMQQLLTGQIRLPSFKGEWEVKRVLELGEVVTGGTPRTDVEAFWGDGYPWITPTDISSSNRDMFTSERTLTQKGLNAIRALPANTVLVTCIASIGKNAILKIVGGCNQQINAVTPNENNNVEFMYYVFEASKQYLLANAGTTATSILSKAAFAQLTFKVPLLAEQTAIAEVLTDMDLELAALEQRREKTQGIKQAMMQELLTGKTRLI